MNSALTFLQSGDVKTFVMNQAAGPAEAFNANYTPDAAFFDEAQEWGYHADQNWIDDWAIMQVTPAVPECPLGLPGCASLYDFWKARVGPQLNEPDT